MVVVSPVPELRGTPSRNSLLGSAALTFVISTESNPDFLLRCTVSTPKSSTGIIPRLVKSVSYGKHDVVEEAEHAEIAQFGTSVVHGEPWRYAVYNVSIRASTPFNQGDVRVELGA
jgi:hypothetical protein